MIDYQKLYYLLFNRITDALKQVQDGQQEQAVALLRQAQIDAEEQYLLATDEKT